MKHKQLPTKEELEKVFSYNPKSGILTRIKNTSSRGRIGKCGCLDKGDGYLKVYFKGVKYKVHRLIFVLVYGQINPDLQVDHINGVKSDNRLVNLRLVSISDNQKNRSLPNNNTSGSIGISKNNKDGKWYARIGFNNKDIYLGNYARKDDAIKARRVAEMLLGYHKNHGRFLN